MFGHLVLFYLFLVFIWFVPAINVFICLLQYLEINSSEDIPVELADSFTQETWSLAQTRAKNQLLNTVIFSITDSVVWTLILMNRIFPLLWNWSEGIAKKMSRFHSKFTESIFFIIAVSIIEVLLIAGQHVHQELIVMKSLDKPSSFWIQLILKILIEIPLTNIMAAMTIIYLVKKFGKTISIIVFTVLGILYLLLTANILNPLYEQVVSSPLPEGELRTILEELTRGVGFDHNKLFYLCGREDYQIFHYGFPLKPYIAITSAFFDDCDQTEIEQQLAKLWTESNTIICKPQYLEALVAYELGRWKYGRSQILLCIYIARVLPAFLLLAMKFYSRMYDVLGFKDIEPKVVGAFFIKTLGRTLLFASLALQNYYVRHVDYEADRFVVNLNKTGDFIMALKFYASQQLIFPVSNDMYQLFTDTQYSIFERVRWLHREE